MSEQDTNSTGPRTHNPARWILGIVAAIAFVLVIVASTMGGGSSTPTHTMQDGSTMTGQMTGDSGR